MIASKKKVTKPAEETQTIKLQGFVIWIFIGGDDQGSSLRFEITNAILRGGGKEIAFDCNCANHGEDSYIYTVILRREDSILYRGDWSVNDGDRSHGTCSCRLYSNGPRIALIGTWYENGGTQQWVAELSPV